MIKVYLKKKLIVFVQEKCGLMVFNIYEVDLLIRSRLLESKRTYIHIAVLVEHVKQC